MANYANLLATIAANVYTNGNNEVTAAMVKAALNDMVDKMGKAGYLYKGVATTSANPGTPDSNVFYIATEPGTYTNFGGLVVNAGEVAILKGTGTSWTKVVTGAATAAQLSALGQEVDGKLDIVSNSDTFYITDENGNVIAKIDDKGIKSTNFAVRTDDEVVGNYGGQFYITDENGNAIVAVKHGSLQVARVLSRYLFSNTWAGKVMATYGDSITALNNGDFSFPFSIGGYNWGNVVAKYFGMEKHYGRGIGSTCYKYRTSGGQVAWCKSDTGEYVGRNDSYTYDNYAGSIPAGCTKIRGDGSSWLRITTMFPASIKDSVDVVLIQFHNDFHQDMDTDVAWVALDSTDPEWAASDEYSALGGDYNISSVKGGIASVIMKMQAWMPNAMLILMTPISGVYTTSGVNSGNFNNSETEAMKKLRDCVMDVAARMSIPCIDVYGTDGINTLNRTKYISDTIHPGTIAGRDKIGRAVVSGLSNQINI